MPKSHHYSTTLTWPGVPGDTTADYKSYSRNHEVSAEGRPVIPGSSDPAFRGDASRYSPEDLLLASLAGCHMLWYLHLCAVNNVVVVAYSDHASGEMQENSDGSGQFTEVTLRPDVVVSEEHMIETAEVLHAQAHKMCFIARSVNFPVRHAPKISSLKQV